MERLQKIIAQAGICSRRQAESLILDGAVSVNGHTVTELGAKADPAHDRISVRGHGNLHSQVLAYVALYKPVHVVTTAADPEGRLTVMNVLEQTAGKGRGPTDLPRVYPVGRLDFDAEGLVIMTNDGELANKLMHPRYGVPKTYHVKVKGRPTAEALTRLREGVRLPDMRGGLEPPTKPAQVSVLGSGQSNSWLELTIKEGRHHQIKRMCQWVGFPVLKLIRVRYGGIELTGLRPGEWRFLTNAEVEMLQSAVDPEHSPAPEVALPDRAPRAHRPGTDGERSRERSSRSPARSSRPAEHSGRAPARSSRTPERPGRPPARSSRSPERSSRAPARSPRPPRGGSSRDAPPGGRGPSRRPQSGRTPSARRRPAGARR